MQTTGTSDGIISYSQTAGGSDNEFLIYAQESLYVYVGGASINSGVSFNDGQWHYITIVWDNSGVVEIYDGGKFNYSTSGLAVGDSIISGGCFEIGQEQDSNCGGFSASQSYNGLIDNLMIFNSTLTADEVYQLYTSNLYKYDSTQWYLYVNQSKNATTGLANGTYTYQAFAKDTAGNLNQTESRSLTIGEVAAPNLLTFKPPTPDDKTTTDYSFVPINVSIALKNLSSVTWDWNGTNHTLYNESLVLFMNMNNLSALGESNTKVVDNSIYGNNGTPTAAVFTANGKYGGAYSFDGSGDRVTVPDEDMYTFSSGGQDKPFSIAAWVYHTGFDSENALISKYQNSGSAICEWNTQTIGNNYYFQLLDGSYGVRIKIRDWAKIGMFIYQ